MSDICAIATELAIELATTRQRYQIECDLIELHFSRGRYKLGFKSSSSGAQIDPLPAAASSVSPCPSAVPASAHNAEAAPSSLPGTHALCVPTLYDRVHVFPKGRWAGHYWCFNCRRPTELLDSDTGLAGKRCEHCRSEKLEWRVGTPELPHWAEDPPEPNPKQVLHRLAPEQRDLRQLAARGYHFCNGCQNVTEKDRHDRCLLCKSDQVEWHDPVFTKEEGQ